MRYRKIFGIFLCKIQKKSFFFTTTIFNYCEKIAVIKFKFYENMKNVLNFYNSTNAVQYLYQISLRLIA